MEKNYNFYKLNIVFRYYFYICVIYYIYIFIKIYILIDSFCEILIINKYIFKLLLYGILVCFRFFFYVIVINEFKFIGFFCEKKNINISNIE